MCDGKEENEGGRKTDPSTVTHEAHTPFNAGVIAVSAVTDEKGGLGLDRGSVDRLQLIHVRAPR
jgi:hypothetical protein